MLTTKIVEKAMTAYVLAEFELTESILEVKKRNQASSSVFDEMICAVQQLCATVPINWESENCP